jgi:hypothetical protein
MSMRTKLFMLVLVLLGVLSSRVAQAFYNPSTGRWLSRDPIGEGGGKNLQATVNNNTPNRIDILGLAEDTNGSGGKTFDPFNYKLPPKKYPPACPSKCCECAVAIDISNVEFRQDGIVTKNRPGHMFSANVYLEYHPSKKNKGGEAKLKWEEKSNRPAPFMVEKGAIPGEWSDVTKLCPECDTQQQWLNRGEKAITCDPPVGKRISLFDWPIVDPTLGKRTLQFRITVENPKDCECEQDKVTVTALQVIDPSASPVGEFKTPDPSP